MGGRQPHVILTDEDPAMRIAVGIVFNKSQHRNCRWHITRHWEYELDQLYAQHKGKNLKERFESLINYPLGPSQFEEEWHKLVDECGIAENEAIKALWEKRKSWIPAYFKGMYCGRMTSTQRSESQNRVLKDGYVSESTSLHMFAKRMLDSLQHADHMDAGETHYAQAEVSRASKAKFDEQLSKVYTRAVYKEYRKQYNNSTAFIIESDPDPNVHNGYLVRHETGEGSFCWAQHAFKVVADKEVGKYTCECKQWEHTGLFCMHIIRVFTHLQVRKIPEEYILKRYTRNAKQDVPWDRHDAVRIGPEASKEQTRLSKLLPMLMRLGRAGSRSDRAYDETVRLLEKITPGVEMIQSSADDNSTRIGATITGLSANAPDYSQGLADPSTAVLQEQIKMMEPLVSRTKGRKPANKKKNVVVPQNEGNPLSTYKKKNYGNKECLCCGVRGSHYTTTCPHNPKRSKAAEKRSNKKTGETQDRPRRKRGRPKKIQPEDDDEDENIVGEDEFDETHESDDASNECGIATKVSRAGRRLRPRVADVN
ncbi:unnamed protein product [Urochloa humidicola]